MEQYLMQHSEEHDNHWLLVDKVNNVVITFDGG